MVRAAAIAGSIGVGGWLAVGGVVNTLSGGRAPASVSRDGHSSGPTRSTSLALRTVSAFGGARSMKLAATEPRISAPLGSMPRAGVADASATASSRIDCWRVRGSTRSAVRRIAYHAGDSPPPVGASGTIVRCWKYSTAGSWCSHGSRPVAISQVMIAVA